jgi:NAD(P)-dependent dehydrogenase (short-subunit alcohol dehydrogenase family)
MSRMILSEKIAVITGGGSGIGKAITKCFAEEGARIIIADLDRERAQETVKELELFGYRVSAVEVDVTVKKDVEKLAKECLGSFGRIDILINNAGITHEPRPMLEIDIATWERVTSVNYKGVFLCSLVIGREMVKKGAGTVINISSVVGIASAPLVAYGPSKSAVIMLTKILATEWGKYNIRVNSIAPGYTLTPMLKKGIETGKRDPKLILRRTPMGKLIEPEDIANAALFLVSDRARYITGVTLPVDAGFLADGAWSAYGGY